MVHHSRTSLEYALEDEPDGALRRGRQTALDGPVVQRLSLQGAIPLDDGELHAPEVAPATIVEHKLDDAARDAILERWSCQSCSQRLGTASQCPGWHQHVEASEARGIWVLIDHHIGAGLPRGINHGERDDAFSPRRSTHRLVMCENYGNPRASSDLQRFCNSFHETEAFFTQVRGVDTSARCRLLRQGDDFIRCGVVAGHVAKARAQSECTVAHGLRHHGLHAREFGWSGGTILGSHHLAADGIVPGEIGHIHSESSAIGRIQIRTERPGAASVGTA